jgi:hypothetical protein
MGIHEKETERSLVSDYRPKYKQRPDYSKASETVSHPYNPKTRILDRPEYKRAKHKTQTAG